MLAAQSGSLDCPSWLTLAPLYRRRISSVWDNAGDHAPTAPHRATIAVIKMRWRDLDLKTGWWTIPGEHAKNGRAHRVPLVLEAIAIIKSQQKDKQKQKKGTDEE